MVGQDVLRIGQVHEQQSADDGVERLVVDERPCVAAAEVHVWKTQLVSAPLGDDYLSRILLKADDVSVGSDDVRHLERHVARTGAEVEDPHPCAHSATLEEQSCRFGDYLRLYLQTRDFGVVASQNVFGAAHVTRDVSDAGRGARSGSGSASRRPGRRT